MLRSDVLLAWSTVSLPTPTPPCPLHARIHALPPSPKNACGSKAALLFKVKPLRHVASRRRLPSGYGLLIGVPVLVLAAHALEQRQGEDGVEDHDKQDVEVSVVISLPGAGDGGRRTGTWQRDGRGGGESLVGVLLPTVLLEELPASGEESEQEGPVHWPHARSEGEDGPKKAENLRRKPKISDQGSPADGNCEAGTRHFRKGTL